MMAYCEAFDAGQKKDLFIGKVKSTVPRRIQVEEMKFFLSGAIPVTAVPCTCTIMYYY